MGENGALEKALEELINRVLENRLAVLQEQLRREISSAVAGLSKAGVSERVPEATPPPAVPVMGAPPTAVASAFPTLNQSVSRILQPTSQTEILNTFLQGAAEFCGRCALFVLRGNSFTFWRARGFAEEAAVRLREVSVPVNEAGIFKEVYDDQLAVSSHRSPESLGSAFDQALGECAEPSIYLFPIVVQGRMVAALYGDAGAQAGSVEPAGLEVLARVVGLSLATAATRQARQQGEAATPTAPREPAAAPPTQQPEMVATPELEPAMAAELQQESPVEAEQVADAASSFEAAPVPVAVKAPDVAPPPDLDSLPEEDRDTHRKAHRRARVAVQDLLSYHKDKIEEGRRNKNLYALLREDMDKTRQDYQSRFGQTSARSFDYLHYELVLNLAGKDPSALGSDYPGPVAGNTGSSE